MLFLKPKCANQSFYIHSHTHTTYDFTEPCLNFKMHNEFDKLPSELATNSVVLFIQSLKGVKFQIISFSKIRSGFYFVSYA